MSDIGSIEPPKLESDDRAGQFGPTLTVWNRWQPACDTCGRLESSLTGHGKGKKKQQQLLLSCSGCLLSKYCSVRLDSFYLLFNIGLYLQLILLPVEKVSEAGLDRRAQ